MELTKLDLESDERSLDNPNLPLTDAEIWYDVGLASRSDAGVPITAQTALRYSPVRQAVSLISGDVAKLPLNVYRREDNNRTVDRTHPANKLIRRRPNAEMSAFKFWRRAMVHSLLWNEAFALIDRDERQRPVGLYLLCPDRTKYVDDDERVGVPYYLSEVNRKMQVFFPSQILHIEGITINGGDCELIQQARDAWALGLVAEKYASKFFKNGAKVSGILELPYGMTKAAADKVREGFYKTTSQLDEAFKTVILRDGAKFHENSVTPRDGLMADVRDQQVKEVARTFNLPPHKLGAGEKFSYNSLAQENKAYLDSTLSHHLCSIQAECDLKLLSEEEQDNDSHYCEHNTKALLQADPEAQVTMGVAGVTNGLFTRNEWRATQNMNSIPGGDALLQPLNMGTVTDNVAAVDDSRNLRIVDLVTAAASERVEFEANKVSVAIKARAKKHNRAAFSKWIDTSYGELRGKFEMGINGQCAPLAMLAGVTVDEFTARVADNLFEALGADIHAAIEREQTDEALRLAITDTCESIKPQLPEYVTSTYKDLSNEE